MEKTPVLQLSNVTLLRDGVTILSDVSWTITEGRNWALLGPNGCGKTTLLKVIAGYEWPTTGEVRVLGETFGKTDIRLLRMRIGWVSSSLLHRFPPQDSALKIAVSGLEASVGLWRDFTAAELDAAHAALKAAGATGIANRDWNVLSQGERQRVLIARALIGKPALLILDEPCAGLDPAARESFLEDLERLTEHEGAPTILFVTHHVEELRPFVTDVLMLRDGRALVVGSTRDVIDSENITQLYGRECRIKKTTDRYSLQIE